MSRDEATHYTIGVVLPQNPFSHINFAFFQVLLFIQQLGSLIECCNLLVDRFFNDCYKIAHKLHKFLSANFYRVSRIFGGDLQLKQIFLRIIFVKFRKYFQLL